MFDAEGIQKALVENSDEGNNDAGRRIYRNICTKVYQQDVIRQSTRRASTTPLCVLETKQQVFIENMAHSPPRAGSWYHPPPPQGSSSGPPPMPKPSDRRSPGPPPDWYRWKEYYRGRSPPRGQSPPRGSPPRNHPRQRSRSPRGDLPPRPQSPRNDHPPPRRSPSPRNQRPPSPRNDYRDRPRSPHGEVKPPSPRRDRPPSPWDFRRRSPPRAYHRPPPPEWRKRSPSPPPHWVRRSPPPYGPPRGRSPPRWAPPPPEWDRYRGPPPPGRRSPPRWAPPPYRGWERRWEPPPTAAPPGPPHRSPPRQPAPLPPPQASNQEPNPTVDTQKPDSVNSKENEEMISPAEEKEEEIENFDLPDYDPEVPLGQKYVIAVSGFFCKICHKFYNTEASAKITHCKSKNHYDKFAKWLSEKQVASLIRKRDAEAALKKGETEEQPPNKQIKLEPTEPQPSADAYDPSQPTEEEANIKPEPSFDESDIKMEVVATTPDVDFQQSGPEQIDSNDQNGNPNQTTDSDSEALITPETKKDDDGFVEATLYNLRKMKVNQLKANLEKRGLKCTGLKTLLLKRLEKVLMEEAAAAAEAEQTKEEEQTENEEAIGGVDNDKSVEDNGKEYTMNLHESDIEASNRKTEWITEEDLRSQLMEISGVTDVGKVEKVKSRVGRKSIVEWTICLRYQGDMPEEGLSFSLPGHQQLPFKVELAEEEK